MADFVMPTTQENYDDCIEAIEGRINQTVPANDASFVKALAFGVAALTTGLYKVQTQAAKQGLAISASGTDLETIGSNFKVIRKAGLPFEFTCAVASNGATEVDVGSIWIGDKNGQTYICTDSWIDSPSEGATYFQVVAVNTGDAGAVSSGDYLSSVSAKAGILSSKAFVVSIVQNGVNKEDQESYRRRVLSAERSVGGGGNGYDLRRWAEAVDGVERAFPYTGFITTGVTGNIVLVRPGFRTIFVESSDGEDGIADESLLQAVLEAIETDPEDGLSRQTLGESMNNTFVRSIYRTAVYVTIFNVTGIEGDTLTAAKAEIESEIESYLASMFPYIAGLDVGIDRNEVVTKVAISRQIQDVLMSYGGFATDVQFGVSRGSTLDSYTLDKGELLKLADNGISWSNT